VEQAFGLFCSILSQGFHVAEFSVAALMIPTTAALAGYAHDARYAAHANRAIHLLDGRVISHEAAAA
jgi:hypothetical protein